MRCLNRNKVDFFYALYEGREAVVDNSGRFTGEYRVKYGDPIHGRVNISAAKGETLMRQFGEDESYDKIVVADIGSFPIDEFSRLWVDVLPVLNDEGALKRDETGGIITPYDYEVKKVAKSINNVLFAISKVNVSGN